jgi:hypothetical protein
MMSAILDGDGRYMTYWMGTSEDLARIEAYIDGHFARH